MSTELDALIVNARQRLHDATRDLLETGDPELIAKVRRNKRILRDLESIRDGSVVAVTRGQTAERGPVEATTTHYADGSRTVDVDTTWMWNGSTL